MAKVYSEWHLGLWFILQILSASTIRCSYFQGESSGLFSEGHAQYASPLAALFQMVSIGVASPPAKDAEACKSAYPHAGSSVAMIRQAFHDEDVDCVRALFEKYGSSNSSFLEDTFGEPLIHTAAKKANIQMIRVLAELGANVNQKNPDIGETPLMIAADIDTSPRDPVLVKLFGENPTTLEAKMRVIQELAALNADVNLMNEYGGPLHRAARRGPVDIVSQLLSLRADVNAKNAEDMIPIHEAIYGGSKSIVDLLILNGADVDAKGNLGDAPLHLAAFQAQPEFLHTLLESGADVNVRNDDRATPMHSATLNCNDGKDSKVADCLKILHDFNADMNARNDDEETPLFSAAFNDCPLSIAALNRYGAETDTKNNDGDTPFYTACLHCNTEAMKVLRRLSADFSATMSGLVQRHGTPSTWYQYVGCSSEKTAQALRLLEQWRSSKPPYY